MAVAVYTTDLITLAVGSIGTDAGLWDESSDAGWDDGGAMVDDGNLYYDGTSCVSAQFTKDGIGSIIYGHGTGITIPTDGAILMWHMWAAPPALATKALGGVRILVGDSFGDFEGWIVAGNDVPPELIWNNYAINPLIGTPDYTVGAPTIYSYFGIAVSALAQARGNPNAMDSIRYGRCNQIYTGGDVTNGYAVLSGYAAIDNDPLNKYSLLRYIKGGLLQQGMMSFGTVATPVDFRDANISISVEDTENVTVNFNRWEVVNAASRLDWTAFQIKALGTTSRGRFEVIDDLATVNHISCTFEDLDTFKYGSNSTLHRRCEPTSQLGATMVGGTIDQPSNTVGLYASNINIITKYTFNSNGTGHGIDRGIISVDTTESWDNLDTGYTALSSGDETIVVNVNSGITYTVNVSDTGTTPSVYNIGTGTVIVVTGQKTLTLTELPTGIEVRLRQGSFTLFHTQDVATGEIAYPYAYSADIPITASFSGAGIIQSKTLRLVLRSYDQTIPIDFDIDPSYI